MGGFTQVPNDILDSMSDLKPAAFKLAMALCRLTYGYHRESVQASLTDLQELTGLSRQGVINASSEIGHLFSSLKEGQTTVWVVNTVDQEGSTDLTDDPPTSQQSRPDRSTELTSSSQQSVPATSSPKEKEIKPKQNGGVGGVPDGYYETVKAYENEIGLITHHVADMIVEAIDEFGHNLIVQAVHIAAEQNKRSWAYVEGILKRWRQEGRGANAKSNGRKPGVPVGQKLTAGGETFIVREGNKVERIPEDARP